MHEIFGRFGIKYFLISTFFVEVVLVSNYQLPATATTTTTTYYILLLTITITTTTYLPTTIYYYYFKYVLYHPPSLLTHGLQHCLSFFSVSL